MNGSSQRRNRRHLPVLIGGSLLAGALLFAGGSGVQRTVAAPAVFCPPVAVSYGIAVDDLDTQRAEPDLPAGSSCLVSPANGAAPAQPGYVDSTAQVPKSALVSPNAAENVWLEVFRTLANDRTQ